MVLTACVELSWVRTNYENILTQKFCTRKYFTRNFPKLRCVCTPDKELKLNSDGLLNISNVTHCFTPGRIWPELDTGQSLSVIDQALYIGNEGKGAVVLVLYQKEQEELHLPGCLVPEGISLVPEGISGITGKSLVVGDVHWFLSQSKWTNTYMQHLLTSQ